MIKYKVLVTAELYIAKLLELREYFDFEFAGYGYNHEMLNHEDFKDLIRDVDILISEFDKVDAEIIDNAKNLKIIICCRGGVNTVVDVEYARSKGIIVCNNIGRNKKSAAVHVLALSLDLLCNISKTNAIVHSSEIKTLHGKMPDDYGDALWGLDTNSPYQKYRAPSISNTVVGIIGYGNIGSEIANMMRSVGFRIAIYDRSPHNKHILPNELKTMSCLLNESDIIVLCTSGNVDKKAIFTSKEFSQMKQSAFFINISRGYLVDEPSLINALNSNIIAGAAIDVSKNEPLQPDDPLISAKNLIITPHIGGSSVDTIICGTDMVISSLKAYLDGTSIPHRVV